MTRKIFRLSRIKYITLGMGRMQLYLPTGKFRDLILQECHDTRYAGHLGVKKTADLILRDFYWPTVQADVATYVATCEECQRNKPSNLRPAGLLQPLEVPGHRWERISMDFITHLPKTKTGYDALLVMVDYITKMMILRPTYNTVTAVETARLVVDSVVRAHGLPRVIVSDRGHEIHQSLLERGAQGDGDHLGNVFGFSPTDRWARQREPTGQ